MIIKSINRIPLLATDAGMVCPTLSVKAGVLFPGHRHKYSITRPSSLALLETIRQKDQIILATYSPTARELADDSIVPLSEVGVTAKLVGVREIRGVTEAEFEGLARVALIGITSRDPYLVCEGRLIDTGGTFSGHKRDELVAEAISLCEKLVEKGAGVAPTLGEIARVQHDNDGAFADSVTVHAPFNPSERQALLECVDVKSRLELLVDLLKRELDRVLLSIQLSHRAETELEERRRREFLELKLDEIKRELGGAYTEEKASGSLKRRIDLAAHLPEEVRDRAWEEASRLGALSIGSAEYSNARAYVETLLSLPWKKKPTNRPVEFEKLREAITTDYYGSESVKVKVYERVMSNLLRGGSERGPIICLSGAPGTGKAALARAIARGLDREFIRISLAGVADFPDIKGTNRSYIGATPGLFIRSLQSARTADPVMYVEDLDYLLETDDNQLALALLEVMDQRLNERFIDNFLGFPYDLSEVLFICSVRGADGSPEPLERRMETVELPGYIEKEKTHIARKYLVPETLKRYELARAEVSLDSEALIRIIRDYTMEAGVLDLSRTLDRLFRHIANERRTAPKKTWKLDSAFIESVLGPPIFIPEKPVKSPEIGVATGLAWTGAGGEIMLIECIKMRGEGGIVYTGSLGDVMKESIQAAHSYIRSKADILGIDHDDFKNFDIHVHFPSGAIPKDGPSAGIAVCLAIASVMAERPIRNDVAMTGEVTLRGKVLPVGGIKEKVAAAHRAGITHVCVPRENEKDLKEIPSEITRNVKFLLIETVDELFEQALLDFSPSAHTLEKLFVRELEKARQRRGARRGSGAGRVRPAAASRRAPARPRKRRR